MNRTIFGAGICVAAISFGLGFWGTNQQIHTSRANQSLQLADNGGLAQATMKFLNSLSAPNTNSRRLHSSASADTANNAARPNQLSIKQAIALVQSGFQSQSAHSLSSQEESPPSSFLN
jgi:hypothetical protein